MSGAAPMEPFVVEIFNFENKFVLIAFRLLEYEGNAALQRLPPKTAV